jgi:hypothetical protein
MKYIVEPCTAFTELEYEKPIRADTLGEPGRITSQIIKLLKDSDIVIADLTSSNANFYYELSLRHALGKPAIHMALEGTNLPFDIQDNRTIFYTMHARVVELAKRELARQIKRVHSKGYRVSNPIIETVGIIQLAQSDNPIQQVLSALVRNVQELSGEVRRVAQVQAQTADMNYFGNPRYSGGALQIGIGPTLAAVPGGLLGSGIDTTLGIGTDILAASGIGSLGEALADRPKSAPVVDKRRPVEKEKEGG